MNAYRRDFDEIKCFLFDKKKEVLEKYNEFQNCNNIKNIEHSEHVLNRKI